MCVMSQLVVSVCLRSKKQFLKTKKDLFFIQVLFLTAKYCELCIKLRLLQRLKGQACLL